MRRILALATSLVLVFGMSLAFAGQKPSGGWHIACPGAGAGGSFLVSPDGASVTWVDANVYVWIPSEPPEGNGYYRFPGPPPKTLTFLYPDYEWTGGWGSYSPI